MRVGHRGETAKDCVKLVEELSIDAFAGHVLTVHRPWMWKCANPKTWSYGFFVIVAPGAILVYGDISEATFRMSGVGGFTPEHGALDWIKRCSKDRSYILSKLSNREAYQSFFPGDAVAWAKEQEITDAKFTAEDFLEDVERLSEDGMDATAFYETCHQHGHHEPPSCIDWDSSAIWKHEAMKTFVRLNPEPPATTTRDLLVKAAHELKEHNDERRDVEYHHRTPKEFIESLLVAAGQEWS